MDRIVTVFAREEAQRRILRMLKAGGYAVAGCFFSGADVIRAVRKLECTAVVCSFRLRDMTAAELAQNLAPDTAVLVIASASNLDRCQGENLYKLPVPASRTDLYASVDMLLQFRRKRARRSPPQRREEAQRLIRRAKELLMDVDCMSEAEAHRFVQKRSMDSGLRLEQTARLIIETYTHRYGPADRLPETDILKEIGGGSDGGD